jgi:hypothetical protein
MVVQPRVNRRQRDQVLFPCVAIEQRQSTPKWVRKIKYLVAFEGTPDLAGRRAGTLVVGSECREAAPDVIDFHGPVGYNKA